MFEILQIYLRPKKKGERNSSQLDIKYETKTYKAQIKMMVRDVLFKDIKLWDDSVMWNICPHEKDSLLVDAMIYFNSEKENVIFKTKWWYTFRSLVKRQINTKRNDTIDAIKRKFLRGETRTNSLIYFLFYERCCF